MIRFTHLSGSPSAVSNYTANERSQEKGIGYYSEKGGAPSQWLGKGAEAQGLSGRVDKDGLERALSGITADGEDLSKRGNHEGDRRMGTDLTFSAPKSVSILAVSDDRIAAAHDKAVANAMRYVESDMAYARLGKGGCVTEYTGSITAAAFRHEDSRAVDGKVDPHLHTHLIICNMTQREDGTWVSLRIDMGHNNIKLKILDEIYKSELARELKKAGYELEQTKDGFEIKGITREQIEAFSSRSKEIVHDLNSHGVDRENATEAQRTAAQNATRKGKTQLSREDQRWEWRDRVRSEGVDADKLIGESKSRASQIQQPDRDSQQLSQESVKSAIRHLGERNTVFSQAELELEAMKNAQGEFDVNDVRQAIENKTGGLLDAGQTDRDGTGKIEQRFTTKTHLYREAEILQRAKNGQGKATPIIQQHEPLRSNNDTPVFINSEKEQQNGNRRERSDQSGFNHDKPLSQLNMRRLQGRYLDADQARQNTGVLPDHALSDRPGDQDVRRAGESGANGRVAAIIKEREAKQGFAFSDGQRAGVDLALTSTDKHLGIVGAAGAGKTTSMSLIVEQYQKAGYEVIGVAPSAAAAKELEAAGCNETCTLASALLKKEKDKPGKRLYVLDEAGMVSAKDYDAFFKKADSEGARTLSVGDPLQLQSVEAGSAFKQLLDTGYIKSVKIDEIQRQKDPQLKEIAQAFADGNADRGVELAQPYMQQVTVSKDEDKTKKLADAASAAYLSLPKDEREQTLLLVGTNKTRNTINEKVRSGLVEQGEVGKETVTVTALDKSDMTREAAKKSKNYSEGMIVEFMDKEKWGDRGSRWELMGKGDKDNQIILQSLDGEKQITLDPSKTRLSVYEKREMQLAQGDQVMFKKNDKERDVVNGSLGKVVDIDQNTGQAKIQLRSGQMVSVSSKETENLDYSYARTVHSSQGATVERAIVVGESGKVSTAQIAYVACSREKTGLQIITDDTEKLSKSWAKFAERQNAIKVTGHELTQTLPELQKSRKEAEKELHEPQPKKQQQQEIKPPPPVRIPKKKKDKGKNKDMELEM